MQFINNKHLKAGNLLAAGIQQNTGLSVVTALFSIYSLEMLKEVLPSIKQLRLLFSSPLDIQNNLALIGDANERKLRNRLTQQFVAKKCEEWFNSHAEIAQTTATALIRQSLFCSEKIAIQGSTELTASGLGFVNPICHDMSIAFDEPEKIQELQVLERTDNTPWLPTPRLEAFYAEADFSKFRRNSFRDLYFYYMNLLEALTCSVITGKLQTVGVDPEIRRKLLEELHRLDLELVRVKTQAKKETGLAKLIELNMHAKQIDHRIHEIYEKLK